MLCKKKGLNLRTLKHLFEKHYNGKRKNTHGIHVERRFKP